MLTRLGSSLITHKGAVLSGVIDDLMNPIKASAFKTLDYFAALMHGGETVRITCYGDSTTDGNGTSPLTNNPTVAVSGHPWTTAPVANSDHNLEAPNSWPVRLQTILRDYHRNNNIIVHNAGYSGQQMQNGWADFYFEKAVLSNPFISPNPDIVMIGFGLNDITDAGNRVKQHISETVKVILKVVEAGATPVLLTCDANWRSYDKWGHATSGRDNEEAAAQIDAAKRYISEAYGVPLIDQDSMQKLWMTKNSDYSDQYTLQPDGLHWGSTGHGMKAAFVAKSFMPDILNCNGKDVERVSWMDSRMRYGKSSESSWVPPEATSEGYKYSRFPRIWYLQEGQYTANELIFDFFVWCDGNQNSLIYRNFGNSNIGTLVSEADLPRIKIFNAVSPNAYFDREIPDTGENEGYLNSTDRPFYLKKLRYGLNRIQVTAPKTVTQQFWGGWFEFNPFWKALDTFGFFNNTGAPKSVQVDALSKTGVMDYRFDADAVNSRVAFLNPELPDGSNSADIGMTGDKVDILVEGFFDTDTGFLFFGGKSLNRESGSTDNMQEDNCLLLYATSRSFNLHQLRYPYQPSQPYPVLATGEADVFSATDRNRKFLIRCQRVSSTQQTIKVYEGWRGIDKPVLNYTGDWSAGKFCGGGVVGGVYATRTTARTVEVSSCLIRKYK